MGSSSKICAFIWWHCSFETKWFYNNTNTQNQRSRRAEKGVCDWNARSLELKWENTKDTLHIYPFLLTGQTGIPTHLVKIETRVWKLNRMIFSFRFTQPDINTFIFLFDQSQPNVNYLYPHSEIKTKHQSYRKQLEDMSIYLLTLFIRN